MPLLQNRYPGQKVRVTFRGGVMVSEIKSGQGRDNDPNRVNPHTIFCQVPSLYI